MSETAHASRRALVCEDEALTAARLPQHLEEMGYDVVAKPQDGLEAVQAAQSLRPDLILMDIKLPGIDGLEATRRIREGLDATVVVITAYVTDGFVEQAALDAGFGLKLVRLLTAEQLDRTPRPSPAAPTAGVCGS